MLTFQLVIFLVVRGIIFWLWHGNSGPGHILTLQLHLAAWRLMPWESVIHLIPSGIFLYLAYSHLRIKPRFLVLASLILIPQLLLFVFYGRPFELRVFYEVYPILGILALQNFFPDAKALQAYEEKI
jgi:hypothetical protein